MRGRSRGLVGVLLLIAAACGGKARQRPTIVGESGDEIRLVPGVVEQTWYRATTRCGQGPYEIEVALTDGRWQEDVEVMVATPRRIALHAIVVADGAEVRKAASVIGPHGTGGAPDNQRCIANAEERRAVARGGGGGATPGAPAGALTGEPPREATVAAPLVIDRGAIPTTSRALVHVEWAERARRPRSIRVRLWSIEPNDLEGVVFGVARIAWRPNVSEAEYDAHQARLAARAEQLARQQEAEWRAREERRRRETAEPRVRVKSQAELEAEYRIAWEAECERRRVEEQARLRRERELAIAEDRRRRRRAFCDAHPADRECWGAGGRRVYLELQQRGADRARYCAANPEDARCWSIDERERRTAAWQARVRVALEPPKQPDGPPPPPRDETIPPKLSANAEWRPGYWHWTGTTWAWLGGMWRVPETDIVADATTHAPSAPPPPQVEAAPPPPMPQAVWIDGFWQWSGARWVWIAGSFQIRPAGMTWRPTSWKPRGSIHVLVPGGWVRGGR